MSIYETLKPYKPRGVGYAIKCYDGKNTWWIRKTYCVLSGIKARLSHEPKNMHFYVYLMPDDKLVAVIHGNIPNKSIFEMVSDNGEAGRLGDKIKGVEND